jgi:hypothetical protein
MSEHSKAPVTDVDLSTFDDEYINREVQEDQFESIPDGKYQTQVEAVELTRTLKGDPMLKWTLKVLGPTHAGRKLWRNNIMASSENIAWLKKDLYSVGLKLERLSELPANLDRLLDIRLEVTKKTRRGDDGRDYESVYINKRIKTADEAQGSSSKTNDALGRF